MRSLGYADAAEASYVIFRRLRDEGAVPKGVRFQVSIPTPYASVLGWVTEEDQQHFFPVYAAAITNEVAEIVRTVDPADLVGMGRIDERGPGGPSLERLLELHAKVAAPIR